MSIIVKDVTDVVSLIREQGLDQKPSIIAIDGRGGAGKSTLARAIVAALPSAYHIEYDWFHLPRDLLKDDHNFDHDRLIREVIVPFREGAACISFKRYNWGYLTGGEDGYHEHPFVCSTPHILAIEGCQLLCPRVSPLVDLRIWVGTDAAVALQRGIYRDVHDYGLEPRCVDEMWREWVERERRLLEKDDRRARADIVVE